MSVKLKSFGLIESVIGATIIVLILSAAVALSSTASKSARLSSAYLEAGHIADKLMTGIKEAKASGNVYFDGASRTGSDNYFSIDCFDAVNKNGTSCRALGQYKPGLPYTPAPEVDGYNAILSQEIKNPAFSDGMYSRFSWKIAVKRAEQMLSLNSPKIDCGKVGSANIPSEKCRYVEVDVKWQESTGEKHYKLNQFFTDWER